MSVLADIYIIHGFIMIHHLKFFTFSIIFKIRFSHTYKQVVKAYLHTFIWNVIKYTVQYTKKVSYMEWIIHVWDLWDIKMVYRWYTVIFMFSPTSMCMLNYNLFVHKVYIAMKYAYLHKYLLSFFLLSIFCCCIP